MGALRTGDRDAPDGRWRDAREHFRDALAVHKKSGDDETYGLANLLDNDGVAALRLGDPSAALERLSRALTIYARDHADTHPDVTRVRAHLAEAELAAGRVESAARLAQQQLDALAAAGLDAPELPSLRLTLAAALVRGESPVSKDRSDRARALAEAALATLRTDPGRADEAAAAAALLAALP